MKSAALHNYPTFKEILIMAFSCASCGLRQSEVKASGAIPTYGTETTLCVNGPEDFKRDVLKGENAAIRIPELDLELLGGTLGGVYTALEGLMEKIYTNLGIITHLALETLPLHHSDDSSTNKQAFRTSLIASRNYRKEDIPFTSNQRSTGQ